METVSISETFGDYIHFGYSIGDQNTVEGVDGGYYYFACSIPGMEEGQASGIFSYRIDENDGEE